MSGGWEFILKRSSDLSTIGKLKTAKSRQLEVDLNKSGSASCFIPTSTQVAKYASPWSTALLVQYSDTPYWSGPLSNVAIDLAAGTVTLSAVGWFERLMHLDLQDPTTSYAGLDAGAIVTDLLAKARAQDPNFPITIGTVQTTQLRSITYVQDQNIGQAILDLANLESGYDWYVDPVTRTLNIVTKLAVNRPNVKWMFLADQKNQMSNLANCQINIDGSTLVNRDRPRGAAISGFAEDTASQALYGVFEEAPSLSTVVDTSILNAYAAGEIVYRSKPRTTFSLTPKPGTHPKAPKLFRDFNVGDITYLTAKRDFYSLQGQAIRIFGCGLDISDVGVETITNLQTVAS